MEENKEDINSSKEQQIFNKMKVNYSKSKEDIWAQMENRIDAKTNESQPSKVFKLGIIKWSLAAVVLALLGIGVFAKFYDIDVSVGKGEFAEHKLPDGSTIYLNAESTINYHPYWWDFNREVTLTGEAFFEVQKGEKFSVTSSLGKTEVLGTSFNIYARAKEYQVYCSTGKVKVSKKEGESVIITPGKYVELKDDKLAVSSTTEDEIISWRINKFIYNTTSLDKVFSDIERQYDIKIEAKNTIKNKVYTGVFDRTVSVEDALTIICLSFDLSFEETDSKTYHVF